MATDPLFGWDLTFKTVEKDIKRKSDILIAFVHWNLSRRGFRSIGIGDERTITGDEEKSELLPTGWNDNENYTVRYVLDNTLYILHGLNTDGNLIINLMRSEDLAVSNIAFNIDDTVKALSGSVEHMMPSNKELIYNLKRDLIEPITRVTTMTVETQTRVECTNNRRPPDDPLRMPPRHMPGVNPDAPDLWPGMPLAYYSSYYLPNRPSRSFGPLTYSISIRDLPQAGLPNLGRSDLDPFAPMAGGGMLFNPFGPRRDIENPGLGIPGGLPRGAVPPGARFDPFAPPAPPGGQLPGRRLPPPDADHLPPPGFNDNMFMGIIGAHGHRFDPLGPPPPGAHGGQPCRRQPPPDADHQHLPGFNDHMFM